MALLVVVAVVVAVVLMLNGLGNILLYSPLRILPISPNCNFILALYCYSLYASTLRISNFGFPEQACRKGIEQAAAAAAAAVAAAAVAAGVAPDAC